MHYPRTFCSTLLFWAQLWERCRSGEPFQITTRDCDEQVSLKTLYPQPQNSSGTSRSAIGIESTPRSGTGGSSRPGVCDQRQTSVTLIPQWPHGEQIAPNLVNGPFQEEHQTPWDRKSGITSSSHVDREAERVVCLLRE